MTIRLQGDLGAGKTCFVQGLATGLDVSDQYDITSPTYTLIHEYEGRLPLFHVDLYRLQSSLDAEAIGLWEILSEQAVVAVEWAERLEEADWPEQYLVITFEALEENQRLISLIGCGLGMDILINEAVVSYKDRCNSLIA